MNTPSDDFADAIIQTLLLYQTYCDYLLTEETLRVEEINGLIGNVVQFIHRLFVLLGSSPSMPKRLTDTMTTVTASSLHACTTIKAREHRLLTTEELSEERLRRYWALWRWQLSTVWGVYSTQFKGAAGREIMWSTFSMMAQQGDLGMNVLFQMLDIGRQIALDSPFEQSFVLDQYGWFTDVLLQCAALALLPIDIDDMTRLQELVVEGSRTARSDRVEEPRGSPPQQDELQFQCAVALYLTLWNPGTIFSQDEDTWFDTSVAVTRYVKLLSWKHNSAGFSALLPRTLGGAIPEGYASSDWQQTLGINPSHTWILRSMVDVLHQHPQAAIQAGLNQACESFIKKLQDLKGLNNNEETWISFAKTALDYALQAPKDLPLSGLNQGGDNDSNAPGGITLQWEAKASLREESDVYDGLEPHIRLDGRSEQATEGVHRTCTSTAQHREGSIAGSDGQGG